MSSKSTGLVLAMDQRAEVREQAAELLGKWANAAVVRDALLTLATDPSEFVRARAVESLARATKHKGAVEEVLQLAMRDADDMVRLNALEALVELGLTPSVEQLWELLGTESEPLVRAALVEAVANASRKKKEDSADLARLLQCETSSRVRLSMTLALYRLGQRSRWRDVFCFLDDEDYHVRSAAVAVLEELASSSRREHVRERLEVALRGEPTVAVRERIKSVLAEL